MPFAATFLWKQVLFRWQQHKAKNASKTDISLTWEKFKAFLCRSLGKSQAFADNIWRTIRKNSWYKQEEVMDWAVHLEHLQTVLRKFDPTAAPTEEVLICYFCNGLKPSIWAQTDAQGQNLDTWEEAIKKVIDAEAKVARQPQSLIKEMHNCCLQGHRPTKTDKPAKEPKDTNKNSFRPLELKTQASQHFEDADTFKNNARKDKKEYKRRDKQDRQYWEWEQKGSTPTIEIYATNTLGGHSSRSGSKKLQRDPAQVTCYNCSKKGHFARNCLKPQKPKN